MPADIAYDPQLGMVMLPHGGETVSASIWGDSDPALAEYLTLEGQLPAGSESSTFGTEWLDVVVALIPRPDNDYNPHAISVAQPASYGGTLDRRHMGFVLDRDHPRLGGRKFHRIARRLGGIDIGCYARVRRERQFAIELYLPDRKQLSAMVEAYLGSLDATAEPLLLEHRQHAARLHAPVGPLSVAPARVTQADILDTLLDQYRAEHPPVAAAEDTAVGTIKVEQRAVFGHRKVYVTNDAGGRLGEVRDRTLFLTRERQRRAALHALGEARIAVSAPTEPGTLDVPYPAGSVAHGRDQWRISLTGTAWPLGDYDPATRTLTSHTVRHLDLALGLLGRAGHSPANLRWEPPDAETYLTLRHGKGAAQSPFKAGFHDEGDTLVEAQVWRMLAHHRAVFPDALADSSPLRWTTAPVDATFRVADTEWMHRDSRYRRDLEALLGPCDTGNWHRGQKPARCRLCDSDALTATVPVGKDTLKVAYCDSCVRKAARGILIDSGTDTPWHDLAVWALQQLAAELGALPSQAQLARIAPTADPAAADRAVLIRMHVPRAPTKRSRRIHGAQRAAYVWLDWLAAADLVGDGVKTARGTASVASDGHLCRSLLERHIDDFFTAAGIAHDVEPHWPYDPELNTTGLRADWLLPDGTFVEAWGLPGEAKYAAKMVRKSNLAARTGIRLVGVTPEDLGRLPELFGEWVSDTADPAALAAAAEHVRVRATGPGRRNAVSRSTSVNANTETRAERLERCARAVKLQGEGLTRADIATELHVMPETVKILLRDGKFYANPHSDPTRQNLALKAKQVRADGGTKAQFRAAENLSTPKAHEAWKDADVLHG